MNLTIGTKYPDWDNLTADDVIGGTLVAKKQIIVYTSPNGTRKKVVNAGDKVGVVYSWLKSGNEVWYQLDSGNGKGDAGFVKSQEGAFDYNTLKNSIIAGIDERKAEIEKKVNERLAGNDNILYRFGKDVIPDIGTLLGGLKWIVFIVLVVILIAVFFRVSGK